MKNYLLFLVLISALVSCTLNAEQEASLSRAVNKHIGALNEGRIVQVIAETYPASVKYYRSLGDEAFKERFTLVDTSSVLQAPIYQDPTIVESAKSGKNIHVEYAVLLVRDVFEQDAEEEKLYAISGDSGKQWYFLKEADYFNNSILPEKERLIRSK